MSISFAGSWVPRPGSEDALERASALAARFEAPVRARVDAGAARAGELGAELRRLGAAEVEVRHAVDEATERVNGVEVELARLDGEAGEARRRLDEALAAARTRASPRPSRRTTTAPSTATSSPRA